MSVFHTTFTQRCIRMAEKDAGKSQVQKFKEAAREAQTDDRETAFDAIVKLIVKSKGQSQSVKSET